jgi:hypothetical protein
LGGPDSALANTVSVGLDNASAATVQQDRVYPFAKRQRTSVRAMNMLLGDDYSLPRTPNENQSEVRFTHSMVAFNNFINDKASYEIYLLYIIYSLVGLLV